MSDPAARAPLAAAIATAAELGEAEQLALLPVPSRGGHERAEDIRAAVQRHRAGRPPGARNLATRQMLDFVRQVIGDPLLERARMAMHTPESLSMTLGCTKLEAAQFLDAIRADLSRLFYAPLAPVDAQGNVVPPSFHMTIGGPAGAPGAGRPPWEYAKPVEIQHAENPTKSGVGDDVSHAPVSHDGAK